MIPRKIMYESDEDKLFDHFLNEIVEHDRYLRFGYNPSNQNVIDYLTKSLLEFGDTNMWFVIEKDDKFIATVHVALNEKGVAEMGFTVSPEHRGKGHGQELFIRGSTWAMMKGATTLYTQCLSENQVMQHIAKKNGMTVVTLGYGEKEASVQATKGTIRAYYDDRMFDNLAFVDMAITKQYNIYKAFMRL